MYLVFVDDARQTPSRPGFKGQLVAVGALAVRADVARAVERALDAVCKKFGFPAGEEFKWSPGRKSWMHQGLKDQQRADFFVEIIAVLGTHEAFATVVMEDAGRKPANTGASPEADVLILLLERIASRLKDVRATGLIVADRPGGDRREEDKFVLGCLTLVDQGTTYVQHEEIAFVLTTDSRFVRLLQAADLVTSCIAAYVAGERDYSPPIAEGLLPLFPIGSSRRGGYSIKIHPDYTFANLYHWLLRDEDFWRYQNGETLPIARLPYATGPLMP